MAISSVQCHALFDILTHQEAYEEIQSLKHLTTITKFGYPLGLAGDEPAAPMIQALIKRFLLVLPGLRDVPQDFWQRKIKELFGALAKADLSESYDKGSIGIRKTLSTACAAMVEYCARGTLGGYQKSGTINRERKYDTADPDDIALAWEDFLQQVVYGDLLDRTFAKAATTDKLTDHESLIQATHEYVLVIMASFLHYILVISPRGQSLLPLLARTKDLFPWYIVCKTLKVGNAATMLNGMVRIMLAKLNMSTVTQWFGAERSDKGMNLLQQIISTVLGWDIKELEKRAIVVEKAGDAPSKKQLQCIKDYCSQTAEEHEQCRVKSARASQSIVMVVLAKSSCPSDLSEHQHKLALDYIAIQLAIRDREEIVKVLCHHQPDLLTSSVEDLVKVYDSIIRALHNAVDLSAGMGDLQAFLHDLVEMSRVNAKSADKKPMSVEDYVRLLKKHQGSSHRFIYQALKNGKELSQWYSEYTKHAAVQYRQNSDDSPSASEDGIAGAGDLTQDLGELISALPDDDRFLVCSELDKYGEYLQRLSKESQARMKTVVKNSTTEKSEISYGPGTFLAKWQALINATLITPATAKGEVRHGGNDSVQEATRVDVDGLKKGSSRPLRENTDSQPPDVSNTLRLLLPGFRKLLVRISNKSG